MRHYNGFIASSPIIDKHKRARCPDCKRFITFDEYMDDKNTKWHNWQCEYCGAFNEHGHYSYGLSSDGYDLSSKECYMK